MSKFMNSFKIKTKGIYIYFLEFLISSFFYFQFKLNHKNQIALDFVFRLHDFFKDTRKKTHELVVEYELENFKRELFNKGYYGIFYMPIRGKQSKYAISLKSLPIWIDQSKINYLKKRSHLFCKSDRAANIKNNKYPVKILSRINASSNLDEQDTLLCNLSPYLYCYSESIPAKNNNKIKGFSIIIPFKNKIYSTIKCISSLIENSSNEIELELILINHASRNIDDLKLEIECFKKKYKHIKIKVFDFFGEFNFSKIINYGVSKARHEYIILCNNDVYMLTKNWDENLSKCVNFYPDNVWGISLLNGKKIDSIGVCFMDNLHPINLFEFQDKKILNELRISKNKIIHTDAVSGAFLCTNKKTFYDTGKFNEELKVSLNDVAFCVLANLHGYNSATILNIEADHKRSLTRENDLNPSQRHRYFSEIEYSKKTYLKNKLFIRKKTNKYWSIPMRGFD